VRFIPNRAVAPADPLVIHFTEGTLYTGGGTSVAGPGAAPPAGGLNFGDCSCGGGGAAGLVHDDGEAVAREPRSHGDAPVIVAVLLGELVKCDGPSSVGGSSPRARSAPSYPPIPPTPRTAIRIL
jgi:hypothetical protein